MRQFDIEKAQRTFEIDRRNYLKNEILKKYELIHKTKQEIHEMTKELQKGVVGVVKKVYKMRCGKQKEKQLLHNLRKEI